MTTRDITDVRYSTPKGFVTSTTFQPVSPLETNYKSAYLVPSNERQGLDVLSILLYRLPPTAHVNTLARQKARIRAYDKRTKTQVVAGPQITTVGGRTAIQEYDFQAPNYKYFSWYVFGAHHVMLLACQFDKQLQKISKGCVSLKNSVHLS